MTERRAIVLTERMYDLLMAVMNDAVHEDPDADIKALRTIIKSGKKLQFTRSLTKANVDDYDIVITTLRELTSTMPVEEIPRNQPAENDHWRCLYCGSSTPMENSPDAIDHTSCPWKRAHTLVEANLK